MFGWKCFYKIKGVRLSKFESKALEGIFVGYGADSHTYRVYDKTSGIVVASCSVEFDENNGSQVAQFHVRDVDDEQPHEAIHRMGVGFYRPIEIHHGSDNGEASSSQQGAPTPPHDPAPTSDTNIAPTQEQAQDPPLDQAVVQEPSTQSSDPAVVASQGQDKDLDHSPAPMG